MTTATTNEDRMKRISKAKVALLLDHPFVGTITLNMKMTLDENLMPPTAATNGKSVFFHPQFIDKLNDGQLLFLVAHEVFHPMFNHCTRRGSRDPLLWNIAADYVINEILTQDGIGEFIPEALLDSTLYKQADGMTDKVYEILRKKRGGKSSGAMPGMGKSAGSSIDNCQDAEAGQNAEELEAEWKIRVAQAAQAAKMAGKLSVGMSRLVDNMLSPKVAWQDVLRRFVVKCRADTRTWARPNRRFISQGLHRPSISGESMGEIVVAVDCSGSIGGEELNQFAAEIRSIQEDMKPTTIHIVYFDSRVCHHDTFDRETPVTIAPHGGGGTAFSPIFSFVDENGIDPVCCVVLTDLCCNDFGDAPNYPVLWVTTTKGQAPWGEIVEM